MRRAAFLAATVLVLAAAPEAMAAQQPLPKGQYLKESDLAPVRDVLTAAQRQLQKLGYHTAPNGRFDADTRNSVELFQSDHGLKPTGNIDLATLAALGINAESMTRPQTAQTAALPAEPENPVEQGALLLRVGDTMSSPQYFGQGTQVENIIGVTQPNSVYEAYVRPPGIDPGMVLLGSTRLRWDSVDWD